MAGNLEIATSRASEELAKARRILAELARARSDVVAAPGKVAAARDEFVHAEAAQRLGEASPDAKALERLREARRRAEDAAGAAHALEGALVERLVALPIGEADGELGQALTAEVDREAEEIRAAALEALKPIAARIASLPISGFERSVKLGGLADLLGAVGLQVDGAQAAGPWADATALRSELATAASAVAEARVAQRQRAPQATGRGRPFRGGFTS